MSENKVKFNLRNVHYAMITSTGFGTVKSIPGAVSLTLDAKGEINTFYADGVAYFQAAANGGYEGDLEIAMIPDEFRIDVLQETKDANGVLKESGNAVPKPFAFGFQIDGDQNETLFWYYNTSVTRPSTEATTNEEQITPDKDKLKLACAADSNGDVRVKTTSETTESVRNGWWNAVYKTPASA